MNTHADRLFRVVFLLGLSGLTTGCAGTNLATQRGERNAPMHAQAVHDELGLLRITGQPTQEELQAFADAGGTLVINNRTQSEMDALAFNERELVESLGMVYLHLPMSGGSFHEGALAQLSDAFAMTTGPALMHCGSGRRSGVMYKAYQVEQDRALNKEAGAPMHPTTEVINAISAARLIDHVHELVGFGTRHTLSETESTHRGIGAARRWVKSEFESAIAGTNKRGDEAPFVEFDAHMVEADLRRMPSATEVVNVVCTLPGAMPEARSRRYYVLAHLDSRATEPNDHETDAPGANDDGSGVAALLELARVLAVKHLDATVVLMATSGEEQGLFGARLHARANAEGIAGVLNNDMIGDPSGPNGRSDHGQVRVFSQGIPREMLSMEKDAVQDELATLRMYGGESDNASRQLARYIADVAKLHETAVQPMLVMRPDRFLRGGDHTPFDELGIPSIRFTEVHESYERQHQDIRTEGGIRFGDVAKHVDAEYLAEVTKLNAATLIHLANAPSVPINARILIAGLTNDTTLRWDACPEPDVAGYEIVWRETTSSVWQHAQDVGNTTEGTVDLSKDNYFFGVRAYDNDGYRSPVAFPGAARE